MRVYSINISATAESLKDLLQEPTMRHTKSIGLQAPKANSKTVFLGNQKIQPFELPPESSMELKIRTFESVYVRGNVGDTLSVALFDV